MSQDIKERREYVRATLATKVEIEIIEDSEFDRIKGNQVDDTPPLGFVTKENGDGESLSGPILQWLIHIDEKLNRILQKLESDEQERNSVCVGSAKNISGVGINLLLNKPMAAGQKIRISFPLPGYTGSPFQAYGEIVRVTPKGENEEKAFETAVKFIIIDETEREKLIAYSFSEQRRAIRNASTEYEGNEGNA